jgi:hypothetical protein
MDWILRHNDFASKTVHLCGLFLLYYYYYLFIFIFLDAHAKTLNLPSFFFRA